ncbi:hypothetical protein HNR42_002706 [Deinobacterium chartae]|uniref:NurA domain-containing protein n=1 Tax=Deinobacterium chartae TaxID=521158 RepID=A0A841I4D9_9DEIO|nr:DNA double-strand break repair nuclease NurA [Deinobacterium chartae]MBB6099268.1 hypothetical protein [Deinobacterium chartae]
MRIRLDPWPSETQSQQLELKPFERPVLQDLESPRWEAVAPKPIPESLEYVSVVDGSPRMEARLTLEEGGRLFFGGYGAYAVGAVELDPHGRRPAVLRHVAAKRILATGGDLRLDPTPLSPRNPHTGDLIYHCVSLPENTVDTPRHVLQRAMLEAEQNLSHDLSSNVEEIDEEGAPLTTLTLQDGPVRGRNSGRAVLGYVKTLQTQYLSSDREYLLAELKPGERTPVIHFNYPGEEQGRYSWYVRLCDAAPYQHVFAGVMRLEMHAPHETDRIPRSVQLIADLSGELLCRLASRPHKDPRAPQNLIPTHALEVAVRRAMGDPALVMRRIRQHVMHTLGKETA